MYLKIKNKIVAFMKKNKMGSYIIVWTLLATMLLTAISEPFVTRTGAEEEKEVKTKEAEIILPEPIYSLDFEQGFQQLMNNDPEFEIVKSDRVYYQKTDKELGVSEKTDANGFIYTGDGKNANYYKGLLSNQATTAYDSEKGTVLKLGQAITIPAIVKSHSADISGDSEATQALDSSIPVSEDAIVQKEYTSYSELKMSNPFAGLAQELQEYDELDDLTLNNGGLVKYGQKYQPLWKKGLTISYWIKVPVDSTGNYKNSSVLRWELNDTNIYQAEDYAKYLTCKKYDEATSSMSEQEKELYALTNRPDYYEDYHILPVEVDVTGMTQQEMDVQGIIRQEYCNSIHYMKIGNSKVRFAETDGELQIDADDSIYWMADSGTGINANPNTLDTYGTAMGMEEKDTFYMNSWRSDKNFKTGYKEADYVANSPVSGNNTKNANADKWQQVTITLQNDWIEFYLNGNQVDVRENYSCLGTSNLENAQLFAQFNKGYGLRYGFGSGGDSYSTSDGNYVCRLLMDWISDKNAILCIGGAGQNAEKTNLSTQSSEIELDDIQFYNTMLSPQQISYLYDQQYANLTGKNNSLDYETTLNLDTYSELTEHAADMIQDNLAGHTINVLKIKENNKLSTPSGVRLNRNPFAGKELNGATIAYWTKQDASSTAISGDSFQPTANIAFIDEPKYIYNPKDTTNSGEASSMLYVKSNGEAIFEEGYLNSSIGASLKNLYCYQLNQEEQEKLLKNASKWHWVVMTMTNGGIQLYVDGIAYKNALNSPAGIRYLDGYYQRLNDESDEKTRYGVFGSGNNQGASTLMSFITYYDTAIYLGYLPKSGGLSYERTSPTYYYNIQTYDRALTAQEIAEAFIMPTQPPTESAIPTIEPSITPEPEFAKGDINQDGSVSLIDANMTLKAALFILNPSENEIRFGDMDGDAKLTLIDANKVLKKALNIE